MTTAARAARSGVARIGLAIGFASVAGYALLAIVGRALSPAEFGLFVAFWGVIFGLAASLSTIEQEVARHAASEEGDGPGPPAWTVTVAAAVLAGAAAATTLLPPVAQRLYGQADPWLGLIALVSVLGVAVHFAVRGLLMGSGDVRGFAWLVVLESALRLVVAVVILVLVGLTLETAAIAVGVGSFAWLAWGRRARALLSIRRVSRATWRAAARRAGALMAGAAMTAAVITGFPTLVTALTDGPPGVEGGVVFAALTVSRVPLLLVSPVQAMAVPFVVRVRGTGAAGVSSLRRALVLGTIGVAVVGGVAAALAWAVGPWLVRLVYGEAYDVPAFAVALLVFSACLLAWAQLLSAAFIALSAHRGMLTMWAVAVAATVVWLSASPLDVVTTTAIGSLVGPLAALAFSVPAMWALTRHR